jgi:hypothetical protein
MIDELILEDVNNIIKKYLQDENMKIAVFTNNAENFKSALVNNTSSPIDYTSPKPQETLDEDISFIDCKLHIKTDHVIIIAVEDLLNNYREIGICTKKGFVLNPFFISCHTAHNIYSKTLFPYIRWVF